MFKFILSYIYNYFNDWKQFLIVLVVYNHCHKLLMRENHSRLLYSSDALLFSMFITVKSVTDTVFSVLTNTHTFKLIASLLKHVSDFLSWSPQTVSVDLCVRMTSCSLTFTSAPTLMENCILIRPMTFAYWAVWEKLGLYPSCAPIPIWQYTSQMRFPAAQEQGHLNPQQL